MMGVSIKIRTASVNKVVKKLQQLPPAVLNAGVEGVSEVQDEIFSYAGQWCPVDTGTLKRSLFQETDFEDNVVHGRVGHGGPNDNRNPRTKKLASAYVIEVHESPRLRRDNGGIHKWLERALIVQKPNYEGVLAAHISTALEGGDYTSTIQKIRDFKIARAEAIFASRAKRKIQNQANAVKRRKAKGYDEESFQAWKANKQKAKKELDPVTKARVDATPEKYDHSPNQALKQEREEWMKGPQRRKDD